MVKNISNEQIIEERPSAILLTVIGILGRLVPHTPNFTPIGGAALFGGSKLSRPLNYALPLGVMMITDIFLGFHATMPFVYLSFMVIAFLGEKLLKSNVSFARVSATSLLGSLVFFIVTNFGVWQVGLLYPHTLAGLINCYVMAIPFFKWTLLGDLVYSNGFFALYQTVANSHGVKLFDQAIISKLKTN